MYVAMLGALLVIMSFLVLVPCYVNKPLFNKAFSIFLFVLFVYLYYSICIIFDLYYSILAAIVVAGVLCYGFEYLKKSKKVVLLNRFFPEQ
jgi:hypothetical protein